MALAVVLRRFCSYFSIPRYLYTKGVAYDRMNRKLIIQSLILEIMALVSCGVVETSFAYFHSLVGLVIDFHFARQA